MSFTFIQKVKTEKQFVKWLQRISNVATFSNMKVSFVQIKKQMDSNITLMIKYETSLTWGGIKSIKTSAQLTQGWARGEECFDV